MGLNMATSLKGLDGMCNGHVGLSRCPGCGHGRRRVGQGHQAVGMSVDNSIKLLEQIHTHIPILGNIAIEDQEGTMTLCILPLQQYFLSDLGYRQWAVGGGGEGPGIWLQWREESTVQA